jgi:hypothetical protein
MLIFTYEIVKMRFLQPGNREPHMRFPPPRNPFSISKNAFIDEYREFSGGMYTHPNKRSLLNT